MTLQELTSDELGQLKEISQNLTLKRLLQSRMQDIKDDDFRVSVKDVDGMLKREHYRGMYEAYGAIVDLEHAVKEEYDLREKEGALAQVSKK